MAKGAIRVVTTPLDVAIGGHRTTPFVLFLDCWRFTLRIAAEADTWSLNGADVYNMFCADVILGSAPNFLQLGGLVVDGQPVNLNEIWRFQPTDPVGGGRLVGVCIQEYWDVNLPDPQT